MEIKVKVINYADRPHYLARWTDPVTGRFRHITTGETNERKAWKFAGELEKRLNEEGFQSNTTISWECFRERFESEYLPSLAESTQRKYRYILNGFEDLITLKNLSSINAQHLSAYQAHLRKKGRREISIKSNLTYLRTALKWAKSQDMINKVPAINLPKRAKASKVMKGRPITGEEFDRMLSVVPKVVGNEHAESIEYFLKGLWWGGLRLDEAIRLTWNHGGFCLVKLDGHYFYKISQDAEKGRTDRFLPVAPQFEMMLPKRPPKNGHVFQPRYPRQTTLPPRVDSMSKLIVRIGRKSGIITDVKTVKDKQGKTEEKKIYATAHDLRRAFGTRWAPLVQPKLLMEMMRHSSIETTMKYYVVGNAQQTSRTLWDVVKKSELGNKSGNKGKNQPDSETVENKKSPRK